MLASLGSSASTRTKLGTHFGPRSGCAATNVVELGDVERVDVVDLDRDHHPVADRIVGHGVHRGRAHRRMAQHDPLDRRGGEVLAVDAQPLVRATGEEEPPVGVAVREIAGPVDAAADLRRRAPPRCGSSPRSVSAGAVLHDLADRRVGVRAVARRRRTRRAGTRGRSRGRTPRWCRRPARASPRGIDASRRMTIMPSVEP